ncbi:protein-glutamine gamma-glutamyltransferase 5 [Xenopus tropicalis]|uniref:protein-glutamine gamma-glutamyltransferase n=1 Tax=Xenopus tropicalis TaxID=8364 RepID=F6Z5P5_XENTR|nr:protein-glutamine gamma-glutamyltransferase 5 [Xenopus tropicalis]
MTAEIAYSDFQIKRNNKAHHTDETGDRRLFIRRGQPFFITVHFKTRGFQPGQDNVIFLVETGPWPDESSGTKAIFPLSKALNKTMWSATLENNGANSMVLAMLSPHTAIIGQYQLKMQISSGTKTTNYNLGTFVLLFNPWCADDDVFMGNEAERQEYVINDYGFVYQGNHNWIIPCAWNFGQFEDDIVDISLKILDKNLNYIQDSFKDLKNRNNPVYISRVICAMINSNDDNGVLQGNWSGDYTNGVSPSAWNGSILILRQWYKSDCQPVKYGQCWVFAAVMCTVMRCLGIPARVVTNFDSAHDTDQNLLIDEYYDTTGKKLSKETKDSIWNFHVWCECWMARRDLPPGYGGWQVLDPTPQEASNGIFVCGPASVKAIREGDIHLNYDAPFVFAMVNADCVSWIVSTKGKEKYHCDPHLVGTQISTKRAGSDEREDLTHQYKYEEETAEERKAFEKAISRLHKGGAIPNINESEHMNGANGTSANGITPSPDESSRYTPQNENSNLNSPLREALLLLKFKLTESPQLGETISLVLLAGNMVSTAKTLKLSLSAQAMKHDGKPAQQFWRDSMYVELGPHEEKWLLFKIPYAKYGPSLEDNHLIRFIAVGEQNITWEKVLVEKDVNLALPAVVINFLELAVVDKTCKAELSFSNPINEAIHDCQILIQGSGLLKKQVKLNMGTMKPGQKAVVAFEFVPWKVGYKQLQVNISSNRFKGLKGFKSVVVKP